MKKIILIPLAMLLAMPVCAQDESQNDITSDNKTGNRQMPTAGELEEHVTVEQINSKMITDLKLTEQQAKDLKKLNKKYKSLIEGSESNDGKPSSGGMGGHSGGSMGGGMGGSMGGGMGGPGGGMGGGMGGPGGGMGGQGGEMGQGGPDMSGSSSQQTTQEDYLDISGKKQTAYEKKLHKILTDEQFTGYQNIKPMFESQKIIKRFLLIGSYR